jgi:hypothetical protein
MLREQKILCTINVFGKYDSSKTSVLTYEAAFAEKKVVSVFRNPSTHSPLWFVFARRGA